MDPVANICNPRYLKSIDRFQNSYISCFLTAGNVKFLLLTAPTETAPSTTSRSSNRFSTSSTATVYNPTAPATEEAVKNFFMDVYDVWVKTIMSPFYQLDMKVTSPVFRSRVAAAAKKYL